MNEHENFMSVPAKYAWTISLKLQTWQPCKYLSDLRWISAKKNTRTVQLKCDGTRWRKGGGKWRGNWRLQWVASTLHTTSEHGVSSITTADAHTSAANCPLNWRPRQFKWTSPFRRKTKSGFCACAITFQTHSTNVVTSDHVSPFRGPFERNVMEFDAKVFLLRVNGCILVCLHADDSNGGFSWMSPCFCSHFKLNFLNIYRNEKYLERKI